MQKSKKPKNKKKSKSHKESIYQNNKAPQKNVKKIIPTGIT